MRIGSRKDKLVAVVFLIISLLVVFIIFNRANATMVTETVPIIAKNIKEGEEITAKNLTTKEISVYNNSNIIKDKNNIIGKYAKHELYKNRYVYKDDIQTKKIDKTTYDKIKDGAVAITTDLTKSVGGLPRQDDYVQISIIIKDEDSGEVVVQQPEELKRVRVLQIQDSEKAIVNDKDEVQPTQVILDMTEAQQKVILKGEYLGDIHLTLLPRKKNK